MSYTKQYYLFAIPSGLCMVTASAFYASNFYGSWILMLIAAVGYTMAGRMLALRDLQNLIKRAEDKMDGP